MNINISIEKYQWSDSLISRILHQLFLVHAKMALLTVCLWVKIANSKGRSSSKIMVATFSHELAMSNC